MKGDTTTGPRGAAGIPGKPGIDGSPGLPGKQSCCIKILIL